MSGPLPELSTSIFLTYCSKPQLAFRDPRASSFKVVHYIPANKEEGSLPQPLICGQLSFCRGLGVRLQFQSLIEIVSALGQRLALSFYYSCI